MHPHLRGVQLHAVSASPQVWIHHGLFFPHVQHQNSDSFLSRQPWTLGFIQLPRAVLTGAPPPSCSHFPSGPVEDATPHN